MSSLEGLSEARRIEACCKQCARFVRAGQVEEHRSYIVSTLERAAEFAHEHDEPSAPVEEREP